MSMYYKLSTSDMQMLISYVSAKAVAMRLENRAFSDISSLVLDSKQEGGSILVPIRKMQEILKPVPSSMDLVNQRNAVTIAIFGLDIVEWKPMRGEFKIGLYGEAGFVYMSPAEYYKAKDFYDDGKKIQAVKVIRDETRCSLKQGVDIYEYTLMNAKKVDKRGE